METTLQQDAPLTRRQAREIERRTGVRPVATPGASFRRDEIDPLADTGRIERNEITALVSVLPTELVEQSAALAPAGRNLTVRAARPAALVAQRRRRTAGTFAAAASVTALAAVGLTTVVNQAAIGQQNHEANLLAAANRDAAEATQQAAGEDAPAQQATPVQVREAKPDQQATQVATLDASAVSDAAVYVAPPAPVPATTAGGSASSVAAGSGDAATPAAPQVNIPATGTIQEKILAYAQAWLGDYNMDCTDYVQNALAAAGLTTPRLEGGPDLGIMSMAQFGVPINPADAQPGDLLLKEGYHVGIYAGNGYAYHGGWNGDDDVNVYTNYQADPFWYDVVIRVTG